ncbi:plastocyanin/azurin family copper-binding protein [Nocardia terpenica]|uniref:plastocyanin/azurin family copper-binding protein n=1 Tax=Nocardia terpenica TaxID=455432 RepID=UPI0031838385
MPGPRGEAGRGQEEGWTGISRNGPGLRGVGRDREGWARIARGGPGSRGASQDREGRARIARGEPGSRGASQDREGRARIARGEPGSRGASQDREGRARIARGEPGSRGASQDREGRARIARGEPEQEGGMSEVMASRDQQGGMSGSRRRGTGIGGGVPGLREDRAGSRENTPESRGAGWDRGVGRWWMGWNRRIGGYGCGIGWGYVDWRSLGGRFAGRVCGLGCGCGVAGRWVWFGGTKSAPSTTSAAGGSGAAASTAPASAVVVDVDKMAFSPASVTIPVGGTVTWKFSDRVPHAVQGIGDSAMGINGPIVTKGEWSHSFTIAGTYRYLCPLHPEMRGTVIVQ